MNERSTQVEEFKDSPLGKIPKDWDFTNIGTVLKVIYRYPTYYNIDYVENGVPEVRGELILQEGYINDKTDLFRYVSPKTASRFNKVILEPEDFVMSVRGTMGKVALVEENLKGAIITANLIRLKFDQSLVFSRWARHLFLSKVFQDSLDLKTSGTTIKTIQAPAFCSIHIKLPPLPEQQRIAEILDTIDRAIARTESLIQKLKQIKAGLLHDLLTCGLNENGELRKPTKHLEQFKDSPLGRIPKEWDVLPVDSCLEKIEQGWSPNCESSYTPIGKWGVLKTTAVVWEGYQDSENKLLPEHLKPRTIYEVKPRDVLMTRAGPNSRVGVVVFVKNTQGKLIVSDKLYRLVPKDVIQPEFLTYALSSNQTQTHLSRLKTGLAESQTNISQDIVRTLWIYLPKIKEQNKITKILDIYDTRIQKEEAHRDKLKLEKKGLMQDLLTGKVRVR